MVEILTKIIVTENGEEVLPLMADELEQRSKDIAEGAAARLAEGAAANAVIEARASRDAKLAKMGFTLEEIANW